MNVTWLGTHYLIKQGNKRPITASDIERDESAFYRGD